MIISYDFGHTASGADTSANGIVYEYKEIRTYAPYVVNQLIREGHTLVNCTPSSNMTLQQSLSYRVSKANASGSKLHLCFHVNAFKHTASAMGAEIEIASDNGLKYATPVLAEICKLGFKNRGIKRPSLYVTKHTNMPAILIEPFFCDSVADCKLYNPEKLGLAIAKGITNVVGGNTKPISVAINGIVNTKVLNVRSGQGTTFSILGTLKLGDKVKIDRAFPSGWTSIYYGQHGGFVSSQYIK